MQKTGQQRVHAALQSLNAIGKYSENTFVFVWSVCCQQYNEFLTLNTAPAIKGISEATSDTHNMAAEYSALRDIKAMLKVGIREYSSCKSKRIDT